MSEITRRPTVLSWEPELTYVVGHQRPDTDAIASALAYAWYLTAQGEQQIQAARAGQISAQTEFALNRFGLTPPPLLLSVAPTLAHASRTVPTLLPDAPLSDALPLLASGSPAVPVVGTDGRAVGMVTSTALARAFASTPEIAAALAAPCREVLESSAPLPADGRVHDYLPGLLRGTADEYLVEDANGQYFGLACRTALLRPPRARLILVDHNELAQSVDGAQEAEILGVLDHHRLGNAATAQPIRFQVEPVGSTCTLVAELCQRDGLEPPAALAGMMLSGILSDTLLFRSPTTTPRDQSAAARMAAQANVSLEQYGAELLRSGLGLQSRTPEEIIDADRKEYELAGHRVSVSQVELSGFAELATHQNSLLTALEQQRQAKSLLLVALLVTDVVAGGSRLLCRADPPILAALPFPRIGTDEWDLGAIVSRKKQFIPALLAVLEELATPSMSVA